MVSITVSNSQNSVKNTRHCTTLGAAFGIWNTETQSPCSSGLPQVSTAHLFPLVHKDASSSTKMKCQLMTNSAQEARRLLQTRVFALALRCHSVDTCHLLCHCHCVEAVSEVCCLVVGARVSLNHTGRHCCRGGSLNVDFLATGGFIHTIMNKH